MKKEKINHKRQSWDQYFLDIIEVIGTRGTCDRGRSGCLIAKNKRILSTGYVGSPAGIVHCDDVGHEMHTVKNEDGTEARHCIRTTHAEQNALAQAARRGVSILDATVYVSMTPCRTCAMLLINSGIVRIVAEKKYHAGQESELMFKKAKIKLEFISNETVKYKK